MFAFGKGKRRLKESYIEDNVVYTHYWNTMVDIAVNVIKWDNLPEGMEERYLELSLIKNGYCYFFKDEILDRFCNLSGANGGTFDIYGNPNSRVAIAVNGYRKSLTPENSVICWNNYGRFGFIPDIQYFANRITRAVRIADVNLEQQRTPRIYAVNSRNNLTIDNIANQQYANVPYIKLDSKLDLNNIMQYDNTAPYIVDKCRYEIGQIWNEFLTFLGIENMNDDKKERMVADEVYANYGNIEASRNTMLSSRKIAAEEFNKMYGTNLEPHFNTKLPTMINNIVPLYTQFIDTEKPDSGEEDIRIE